MKGSRIMLKIQILGTGCPKCKKLAENAEAAVAELGVAYSLEKVTEINEIMKFKIWQTPGLVLNGEVKSTGKVLSPKEIKALIDAHQASDPAEEQ
jgi:small redox-active disulfide protein 2